MNWSLLWKIVLAVIGSVGGIGVVFIAVVKFSSDIIANRLAQKYELKLSKEMETYKANVENKTFISKTKFETEFAIYRQLSKLFSIMARDTSLLFPHQTKDARENYEKYKGEHDRALDAIVAAQDELSACAPFIPKEIYDEFYAIESLCKNQLSDFQDFRLRPDAESYREECRTEFCLAYKRTSEIDNALTKLIDNIRNYLSVLEVLE